MQKVNNRSAFTLIELSIVLIIIGLLVSGVVAGKIIIDKAKLTSARSATKSSVVPQIEDLVLWLDAASEDVLLDDGNNSVADGDEVASWLDINPQKDRKNNTTQETASRRPIYRESDFNGLPSLEFDGTNDFLRLADSDIFNYKDYTIFVVEERTSGKTRNYFIGFANSGSDDSSLHLGYLNGNTIRQAHQANDMDVSTSNYKAGTPVIHRFLLNSNIGKNYQNSLGNSASNTQKDQLQGSNGKISIGIRSNDYYQGYIAEIIIYDRALGSSELEKVMSYLSGKWNIDLQ